MLGSCVFGRLNVFGLLFLGFHLRAKETKVRIQRATRRLGKKTSETWLCGTICLGYRWNRSDKMWLKTTLSSFVRGAALQTLNKCPGVEKKASQWEPTAKPKLPTVPNGSFSRLYYQRHANEPPTSGKLGRSVGSCAQQACITSNLGCRPRPPLLLEGQGA